jgi:hypothetical protein
VVLENVKGFPLHVVKALFADLYDIRLLTVAPEDVGFTLLRRPRRYFLLAHRQKCRWKTDPGMVYNAVKMSFAESPRLLPTSCMLASSDEVHQAAIP